MATAMPGEGARSPVRVQFCRALTASRRVLPALNGGAVEAAMAMLSRVAGLCPWRAARLRVANVPKPAIETFSPRARASAMVESAKNRVAIVRKQAFSHSS